jgi:hypothetical protein
MRAVGRPRDVALLVAIAFEFGCSNSGNGGSSATDDSGVLPPPGSGTSSSGSSGPNASGSPGTSSGQVTGTVGASGASGAPAGSGASGSPDAGVAADSGVVVADDASTTSTGTFPPLVGDAGAAGPYATSVKSGAGPSGNGTVYYPTSFGPNGLKTPIFVWDPGSGIQGTMYATMLTQLASQGFAAYACATSSSAGTEVKDGIDWMIAQNTAQGSIFMGKLDTTKVAAGGHSLGSLAVFANAGDSRLTTTVHVSGGAGGTTAASLKVPAIYLCGETCTTGQTGLTDCDLAAPNCATDFMNTTVPVFYGQNTTASHAFGWQQDSAGLTAWLRWHLMGDTTQKPTFLGPNCGLCATPWVGKSKNLN